MCYRWSGVSHIADADDLAETILLCDAAELQMSKHCYQPGPSVDGRQIKVKPTHWLASMPSRPSHCAKKICFTVMLYCTACSMMFGYYCGSCRSKVMLDTCKKDLGWLCYRC